MHKSLDVKEYLVNAKWVAALKSAWEVGSKSGAKPITD